jgi:hypothetical protein
VGPTRSLRSLVARRCGAACSVASLARGFDRHPRRGGPRSCVGPRPLIDNVSPIYLNLVCRAGRSGDISRCPDGTSSFTKPRHELTCPGVGMFCLTDGFAVCILQMFYQFASSFDGRPEFIWQFVALLEG